MEVTKQGFKLLDIDNNANYLSLLVCVIKHSDPEAGVSLNKVQEEIKVNILPSTQDFRQDIINNILDIHKLLHIKVIFSKSLKIQKNISYSVFI